MTLIQMLRERALCERRGDSRSKLWADIQKGLFPPPVKIGLRAVAWPEPEAEAVQKAVVAGKSPDEIKQLVRQLVAARQAAAQ